MSDLFKEKAQDWDVNNVVVQLSSGIGQAILNNVNLHEDMQVMDFGAGTGLISGHIAPDVKKITAVDISESMLQQLAEKPELQGKVEVVCQDILEQTLNQKFDVIVSAMAMHHVEDTAKMMQRFAEHLKDGGEIALADLDKEDGTFHPPDIEGVYHDGFARDELEKLMLDAGFNSIKFVTAHTVDKEGKQFPVFLVTAKKG